MRGCIALLAVTFSAGCGMRRSPSVVLGPDAPIDVAQLIAAHPLASGAPLRADPLLRGTDATHFVVQVATAEHPHRHERHDLIVTVLRGRGKLHVGAVTRELTEGDVVVVPRGTPHWFENTGRQAAVAMATYVPALDAPDTVPLVDSSPDAR